MTETDEAVLKALEHWIRSAGVPSMEDVEPPLQAEAVEAIRAVLAELEGLKECAGNWATNCRKAWHRAEHAEADRDRFQAIVHAVSPFLDPAALGLTPEIARQKLQRAEAALAQAREEMLTMVKKYAHLEQEGIRADMLTEEIERLKETQEQRCIAHAAFNPQGDCVFCDHEQAQARVDAALALLTPALAWIPEGRTRHAVVRAIEALTGGE